MATGIGIAFVVLASVALLATLLGVLAWLLAVIWRRFGPQRAAPPPTRR